MKQFVELMPHHGVWPGAATVLSRWVGVEIKNTKEGVAECYTEPYT